MAEPQRLLQQEGGRRGVDGGHSSFKYCSSGFFSVHVGSILDFRGAKGSEAEPNLGKPLIWKTSKVLSLGPMILKSLLLIRNFCYLLAR